MLEDLGISVEFSHHEGGPGPERDRPALRGRAHDGRQHHDLPHGRSKRSRSSRASTRRSCRSRSAASPAAACTRTCRCSRATSNAFYEEGAQYQLSKVGRQFIAGLLRHANEISAVTNQFVNSYKRLWGGDEAPSFICWGHNNRSALVRVPLYKPSKGQSSRVEYRALDSAANPYLAYALMLAAGLKGIEEGYELPARGRGQRLVAHRRRAPRPRLRAAAGEPRPRARVHGGVRARRRDARRAGLQLRAAQQAHGVAGVPLAR